MDELADELALLAPELALFAPVEEPTPHLGDTYLPGFAAAGTGKPEEAKDGLSIATFLVGVIMVCVLHADIRWQHNALNATTLCYTAPPLGCLQTTDMPCYACKPAPKSFSSLDALGFLAGALLLSMPDPAISL